MSFLVVSVAVLASTLGEEKEGPLYSAIHAFVDARTMEFDQIPGERKEQLQKIAAYIRSRVSAGQPARLTFICTHNSRRSHLAQVWGQTAAHFYGVSGVETFSGGTEATAFNPRAIGALKRAGFDVNAPQPLTTENPRYAVRFSDRAPPLLCFSKSYEAEPNPQADFCAVMTCSQADSSCPLVSGASLRIAVPYEDPKAFDGTPEESERYDERCRQIAREMLYVFSQV